jgi:hypothetical protein
MKYFWWITQHKTQIFNRAFTDSTLKNHFPHQSKWLVKFSYSWKLRIKGIKWFALLFTILECVLLKIGATWHWTLKMTLIIHINSLFMQWTDYLKRIIHEARSNWDRKCLMFQGFILKYLFDYLKMFYATNW